MQAEVYVTDLRVGSGFVNFSCLGTAVQTERRAVVLKMFNLVFKMFNVGDNLEINSLFIIPRSEAFKNAS